MKCSREMLVASTRRHNGEAGQKWLGLAIWKALRSPAVKNMFSFLLETFEAMLVAILQNIAWQILTYGIFTSSLFFYAARMLIFGSGSNKSKSVFRHPPKGFYVGHKGKEMEKFPECEIL